MGADGDLLRDDARCREAFRAGERWAMAAVYDHYLPLVTTVVTHGAGGFRGFFDPARRDDAVQTVFLRAFEQRARLAYNGLDPYTRFLRGLALNVCRQILDRDRRFDRRPERSDLDPSIARPGPDAEGAYIEDEARALCRAFEATLTEPRERTALRRYFCDGLSEEALAEELGVTRYRARKLVKAVQRRMLRYLARHGIDRPV